MYLDYTLAFQAAVIAFDEHKIRAIFDPKRADIQRPFRPTPVSHDVGAFGGDVLAFSLTEFGYQTVVLVRVNRLIFKRLCYNFADVRRLWCHLILYP